jgi:hypothetical protein
MKPLRLHVAAILETEAAVLFYEQRDHALGSEFKMEFEVACQRIVASPRLHSFLQAGCRCCRMHRFPFGIVFREQDDFLELLAVIHLQRKPGYWLERL